MVNDGFVCNCWLLGVGEVVFFEGILVVIEDDEGERRFCRVWVVGDVV